MLTLDTGLLELHKYGVPKLKTQRRALLLATAAAEFSGKPDPRLATIEDLLHYTPIRYEDRSRIPKIKDLHEGMSAAVEVEVRVAGSYYVKGGKMSIFEFSAADETGQIRAFWFNQKYLEQVFKRGTRVILFGQWKRGRRGFFELEGPRDYEVLNEDAEELSLIHTGRRVPIYRKLGEFPGKTLREIINHVLQNIDLGSMPEHLPEDLRQRNSLISRAAALNQLHFPAEDASIDEYNRFASPGHRRLIFEEFFWLALAIGYRRGQREESPKGTVIEINDHIRQVIRSILPFELTGAQKRVLKQIKEDLVSKKPMNRLLQGDVGCGKTVVALLSAIMAIENGYQTALMVPTEILAEQHARNLKRMLAKTPYRVELLTGSVTPQRKKELHSAVKSGEVDLLVGTHALIQETVQFSKLGLVVIDEQHRFGVMQRAQLIQRGYNPDVLVMTATPIPRSLAMTVYGDLDVSVIDELPPGRTAIKTVLRDDSARNKIYKFIDDEIRAGRQIYIVYPLVEESEKLDLLDATRMAEHLQTTVFPNFRLGLLHGKMKPPEKEEVMRAFVAGEINILIATTVIEVGVDVPNANVMIIEHAERFGLSQLHQLRGRVGRGSTQSYCILLASHKRTTEARERLAIMEQTSDGFIIAEKDLEIRGPGEVMGTRQHGVPTFRVGNIVRDQKLLEAAKSEADFLLTKRRNTRETSQMIDLIRSQPKFGLATVG
ncbi:MAG TPA: ATP-dependent DNA helicase RecG [Blastocatellia bacterium]|nr:ATP-dependent DNA helicase RecG [Blastocatellia bacterium]